MKITPQAADARALEESAKAAFRKAQSIYRADHDHFPIVKTWESTAESVREGWRKIAYASVEAARENEPASPDYRALLEMAVEVLEAWHNIAEHCTISDGMCCCGDDMERHPEPMSCGHSPVDHGAYNADLTLKMTAATLTTIKTALEGK